MGLGPWDTADLMRDVRKAERDRIRRIVKREYMLAGGGKSRFKTEAEQALERILAKITPKERKSKGKKTPGARRVR